MVFNNVGMNLSEMLLEVFDPWEDMNILYQSPQLPDPQRAKYYLFGEIHNRGTAQADHAALIDKTVIPGSVLLVEGFSALCEVKGENRKKVLDMLKISEKARENLTVIGWDRFNHLANPREIVYICQYDKATGYSSVNIDKESFYPLGDKVSQLNEVKVMQKELSEGMKAQISGELRAQIKEIIDEADRVYSEQLKETFPIRTDAMIYTLKNIEKLRLEGKILGHIYLIAGRLHVMETEPNEPRYSLKTLYQELDHLPALVLSSKVHDYERSELEKLMDRV